MTCLEYHEGDLDSSVNQNNVHRREEVSLNVEFVVDIVVVVVVVVVVGRPCSSRSQHL